MIAKKITPFGYEVELMRDELGISQGEMARIVGMPPSALSRAVRGKMGSVSIPNHELFESEVFQEAASLSDMILDLRHRGLSCSAIALCNALVAKVSSLPPAKLERLAMTISGPGRNAFLRWCSLEVQRKA